MAPDGRPATASASLVEGLLRGRLGYRGVVATEDLDMGAASRLMRREQAVVAAIRAGNDLLMVKNLFGHDPLLPRRAVGWVREATADGRLSEGQVMAAAERVRASRGRIGRALMPQTCPCRKPP